MEDRISNLPDSIIIQILSLLPLKEAMKTDSLSRNWRYKWAMVPHILLDESSLPSLRYPLSPDELLKVNELVTHIDRVFSLHIGPIFEFKLCYEYLPIDYLDKWIPLVLTHPITHFTFCVPNYDFEPYEMPSAIFSCQTLTHLKLSQCRLNPPSTFVGFKSLKTLKLEGVTLSQDKFDILTFGSVCLEELILTDVYGVYYLNIEVPKLKELAFDYQDLPRYRCSASIFSCKDLTHLHLTQCSLKPPSTFDGFENLKTLALFCVELEQEGFDIMMSKSTRLEFLDLVTVKGVNRLNLDVPNLKYINYVGTMLDFSPRNASSVTDIALSMKFCNFPTADFCYTDNLIKLLADTFQIRSLCLTGDSFMGMVNSVAPRELSVPCINLNLLSVKINPNNCYETSTLICLLRSAPNLDTVHFELSCKSLESNSISWPNDIRLSSLRSVFIVKYIGDQAENDFIRFVLLASPALATLKIMKRFAFHRDSEIMEQFHSCEQLGKITIIR